MATVTYTVFGGEVLSENRNGVERDYVPDPSGNVVALLDTSQNITDTFQYWSYGELMSRTGSTPINFKFGGALGYHTDGDANIYVRRRRLDPKNGRWTTLDPLWPSEAPYMFVLDNPTTLNDPSGRQARGCPRHGGEPGCVYSGPPGSESDPGYWHCQTRIYERSDPWGFWSKGFWRYGNCCGPSLMCGSGSKATSCTDEACRAHDICVGPGGIFGLPTRENIIRWLPCNKKFCNDIKYCWNRYCTMLPPKDAEQCAAIKEIAKWFCGSFGGGPPALGQPWR